MTRLRQTNCIECIISVVCSNLESRRGLGSVCGWKVARTCLSWAAEVYLSVWTPHSIRKLPSAIVLYVNTYNTWHCSYFMFVHMVQYHIHTLCIYNIHIHHIHINLSQYIFTFSHFIWFSFNVLDWIRLGCSEVSNISRQHSWHSEIPTTWQVWVHPNKKVYFFFK